MTFLWSLNWKPKCKYSCLIQTIIHACGVVFISNSKYAWEYIETNLLSIVSWIYVRLNTFWTFFLFNSQWKHLLLLLLLMVVLKCGEHTNITFHMIFTSNYQFLIDSREMKIINISSAKGIFRNWKIHLIVYAFIVRFEHWNWICAFVGKQECVAYIWFKVYHFMCYFCVKNRIDLIGISSKAHSQSNDFKSIRIRMHIEWEKWSI